MITPSQTRSKYADIEQYLTVVQARVRDTLVTFCDPKGYAFVSRIKTLASLSEKIESGRFTKWSELDDLFACAVVIPTLAEENQVIHFLQQAFQTIEIKRRSSTQKSPEVFRFDTTRFIGRLKPVAETTPGVGYEMAFEVQVRSAFEHAWVVTTHAFTYKAEHVAWSRLRLAAQLKAAVEQLDILVLGFEETSSKIAKSFWPETQAKADIAAFFKDKFTSGDLPIELGPKDWTRFSENIYGMLRYSRGKRRRPSEIVSTVSKTMDIAIAELGRAKIPVSISLVQFVFASLFSTRALESPLEDYCPVITTEMETLYPGLQEFRPRFDFSH